MAARDLLYIQLRDASPDAPVLWSAGAALGGASRPETASLAQVLDRAAGRRIVLFVPGPDVRLTTAQVPAREARKVLQAIPYALEDQLAEDVDTLHFAIGSDQTRRRASDPQAVAIVARERMDAWMAPLRARALMPLAVVPETLALPSPERGRWVGIAETGGVTVRTGPYSGFTCALGDLASYLTLADPEARIPLRLFVTRDAEADFSRFERPLELLPGYASGLEVFTRSWRAEESINLLQGAYAPEQDWQKLAAPWRLAAGLALAWAGMSVAVEATETIRSGRELARQEAQNLARYQALFPAETRIVDLARQAEQQLAALRSGTRTPPLFLLLGSIGGALNATPGLTLQSAQFRDGALLLSLTGTDLQALENLRAWYGTHRDAVLEVQAANAGAEGVQIRLKLSPA